MNFDKPSEPIDTVDLPRLDIPTVKQLMLIKLMLMLIYAQTEDPVNDF